MKTLLIGLGTMAVWATTVLDASAAWNNVYQPTLFGRTQKLTKRQKELLQEFEQQSSDDTQPEAAGFFSKVKDFLDGLGNRRDSA